MLHCGHRQQLDEPWASAVRAAGVRVRMLDRSVSVHRSRTGELVGVPDLKGEDFDAIVFQDWLGSGRSR